MHIYIETLVVGGEKRIYFNGNRLIKDIQRVIAFLAKVSEGNRYKMRFNKLNCEVYPKKRLTLKIFCFTAAILNYSYPIIL